MLSPVGGKIIFGIGFLGDIKATVAIIKYFSLYQLIYVAIIPMVA